MSHKSAQEKMTQPWLLNTVLDATETLEKWNIIKVSIWNLES